MSSAAFEIEEVPTFAVVTKDSVISEHFDLEEAKRANELYPGRSRVIRVADGEWMTEEKAAAPKPLKVAPAAPVELPEPTPVIEAQAAPHALPENVLALLAKNEGERADIRADQALAPRFKVLGPKGVVLATFHGIEHATHCNHTIDGRGVIRLSDGKAMTEGAGRR